MTRGTRGAYRKEDRVALPPALQEEIVEKAAAKYGNCQELAKHLEIPKSSVHYYRVGRLTMPESLLKRMLDIAGDDGLRARVDDRGITKDRTWANEYAVSIYREICREKVRLPTRDELQKNDDLRRKAATIISYMMAEGSVWLQKKKWGECAANITFAEHETDLYEHFRDLCNDVFDYDIGTPQKPGNGAKAIRGFIYSRFVAEWLMSNNVHPGDKAEYPMHIPDWVMECEDEDSWIRSIQPWFDGEGSVIIGANNQATGFSVSQSVHTDLDLLVVPHTLGWRGASRNVPAGTLRWVHLCGISVGDYITAIFRSPALDDLAILLNRLGIASRTTLTSIYLKDDGFWSANWEVILRKPTLKRLLSLGLVRQERKVMRIVKGR
jgi:hypothetical protein